MAVDISVLFQEKSEDFKLILLNNLDSNLHIKSINWDFFQIESEKFVSCILARERAYRFFT
jgi:hypothetical protein